MFFNGTVRYVENRPFFGTIFDGKPVEVGLFNDGFHCGCFVDGQWLSLGRVVLTSAWIDNTGQLKMEWAREKEPS